MNIPALRLAAQQISVHRFHQPGELLSWFGALQAQDYAMAKWAIGCRLPAVTESRLEADFNSGKILRTHVLRPTWHFVSPQNIRWMLRLTAPKIKASAATRHAQLGLDARILKRSKKILEKAMAERGPLSRIEIQSAFSASGIVTDEARLGFLLMDAELDGLICSAGRKGKQFAYGLLDKLVPAYPIPEGTEAVSVLARNYFNSHGPATVRDFAWWSSLPQAEIKAALPLLKSELISVGWKGKTFWHARSMPDSGLGGTYFLPAFDEYLIGYRDRDDLINPSFSRRVLTANGIFNPVLVRNGLVEGSWKKREQPDGLRIELSDFLSSSSARARGRGPAIKNYYRFLGRNGTLLVL